jgi:endonuclease/exonuclease/phosphatase family metal-dependent hydrolase
LSETPDVISKGWDAACHRVCTQGVFTDKKGSKIIVLNTHFDHTGQEARENSARLILKRIQSLDKDIPLVLMGDFNVEPDNPVYTELSVVLRDAGAISQGFSRARGTFNAFKLKDYKNRRIDYIFYQPRLVLLEYEVAHPLTQKGRQLSDHFPVFAKLKFEK